MCSDLALENSESSSDNSCSKNEGNETTVQRSRKYYESVDYMEAFISRFEAQNLSGRRTESTSGASKEKSESSLSQGEPRDEQILVKIFSRTYEQNRPLVSTVYITGLP